MNAFWNEPGANAALTSGGLHEPLPVVLDQLLTVADGGPVGQRCRGVVAREQRHHR
ncbi:hypothetical protein ACFOJ6_17500 [Gordonia humi]|uniref:hypothetical protein n=1 Tax=Gordonia humi TaxID=686429 RepID=UPI0036233E88